MTFKRQQSGYRPGLTPNLAAAVAPSSIPRTTLIDSAAAVADAEAQYRAAVVASLQAAIQNDNAMWMLDRHLAYRWQSNAVCQPRSEPARAWHAGGPCGLDRIDCDWGFWRLDEECNGRVFTEHMFQFPRYVWAQAKLAYLLGAGKPPGYPTAATADRWSRWVWDVLQYISVAYWSTNVSPNYPGHMGPGRFDTTPYLNTKGPAWDNFLVRVRPGGTMLPPGSSAFSLDKVIDLRLWGQSKSGWARGSDGQPVLVPPGLPQGRESFDPRVFFGWGPDRIVYDRTERLVWPEAPGFARPRTDVSPYETFALYMRETARVAERQYWYRTRQQYPLGRRTGAMEDVMWPTAELTVLMVETMARDVVDRTMGTILAEGLLRWNDALLQLPGDYRTALFGSLDQYQQFARAVTNASMDTMLGGIQAGTAVIGAIAGAMNAGAGAVVAVYSALLQGMHEILKATDSYATGSGSIPPCPPIPMIRTMAQAACNFELVATDGSLITIVPDVPERIPSPDPPPVVGGRSSNGGGAALLGGAAFLALLFAMRK